MENVETELIKEYNNLIFNTKPEIQFNNLGTVIKQVILECKECKDMIEIFIMHYDNLMYNQAEAVDEIIDIMQLNRLSGLHACTKHFYSKNFYCFSEDDCFTFPWYIASENYMFGKFKIACECIIQEGKLLNCGIIENAINMMSCECGFL